MCDRTAHQLTPVPEDSASSVAADGERHGNRCQGNGVAIAIDGGGGVARGRSQTAPRPPPTAAKRSCLRQTTENRPAGTTDLELPRGPRHPAAGLGQLTLESPDPTGHGLNLGSVSRPECWARRRSSCQKFSSRPVSKAKYWYRCWYRSRGFRLVFLSSLQSKSGRRGLGARVASKFSKSGDRSPEMLTLDTTKFWSRRKSGRRKSRSQSVLRPTFWFRSLWKVRSGSTSLPASRRQSPSCLEVLGGRTSSDCRRGCASAAAITLRRPPARTTTTTTATTTPRPTTTTRNSTRRCSRSESD